MTDRTHDKTLLAILPKPMGDVVLCTPALRYLKQALPGYRVAWMGGRVAGDLLRGLEWAEVFYDRQGNVYWKRDDWEDRACRGFDGIVMFSNSFRTAWQAWRVGGKKRIGYQRDGRSCLLTDGVAVPRMVGGNLPVSMIDYYGHLAERTAGVLGGDVDIPLDSKLELAVGREGQAEIEALEQGWQLQPDDKLAGLVVGGAFGPSKLWPAERYGELADWLTEEGFKPILIVAPDEVGIAQEVVRQAKSRLYTLSESPVSLHGLKALIQRCRLMAGNDTGPAHIAAAFGVPMVTLFGPTDPRWTATDYTGEARLRVNVDCGPCQQKQCVTDHRCLLQLRVADVQQAVRKVLTDSHKMQWNSDQPVDERFSVYQERYRSLADDQGVIHKQFYPRLKREGLDHLEGVFRYQQGEALTKPGLGYRERIRIELNTDKADPVVIYLKRFGRPPLKERIGRYLTHRTPLAIGAYDFSMAQRLARIGVAVPRPIAWGGDYDGWGERRSFAMIEELPRGQALSRLLSGEEPDRHGYRLLEDKRELTRQLARLAAEMHGGGYCHRDLYLCHVFLCKDRQDEEFLALIDLQRVFQPRYNFWRWRVKDLSQLCYSARQFASRTEMMRFMHDYLERNRLDQEDKKLVRAVYAKARRIEKRQLRKQREQQSR